MASNYVEIKVKASDTAKPDLTDLKVKLDELGAKVETARVDVDDADAEVKLLRMNAKLADLNAKVSNPKIKVAGAARAEAEIVALGHELDKLNRKAGPSGLLGRILGGSEGGMGSIPGGLPLIGGMPLPALLAIVPAIGAALVEVTGLVSGFAAAGAGAGSFALLAAPAVKQVETAYTALNTAQQKFSAAQAKEAMDPSKANASAVKAAKLNLMLAGEAIGKLPDSEQKAIDGLFQLRQEFTKLATAFQPEAFKVFASGLQLVNKLLPDIVPFANTFADVLSKLLGQASKFAGSKGFADWLKQFHSLEGPALNSIGAGIGKVVVAVGKLLTVMSGKDVAHAINIAFDAIAGVINGVTYAVRRLMQNWDGMSSAFRRSRHDVAGAFDAVRHAAASMTHDVAHSFDTARHSVADFGHNIASQFDHIRANIARWAADVARFIRAHWKLILAITTAGLGLIVDAVATHWGAVKHGTEAAWNAVTGAVRGAVNIISGILRPFVGWFESLFKAAWGAVASVWTSAWSRIHSTSASGTSAVKGVLNWFGKLGGLFHNWWGAAVNAVSAQERLMLGVVRRIPGAINSALGGLPAMLFRAGVNAIKGLINGIMSMFGAVGNAVSSVASKVAGFFGLSRAKEGPLSGGGAPWIRGQHLVQDIAGGMLSSQSHLARAATTIAGTAVSGAAAGGGGHAVIQIAPKGGSGLEQQFWTWLKNGVRAQGGDPSMFQKKVSFR